MKLHFLLGFVLLFLAVSARDGDDYKLSSAVLAVIGNCDIKTDEADKQVCADDASAECMNAKALYYTNILRACASRNKGSSARPLMAGTHAMLGNAIDHSLEQARKNDLYHQSLRGAKFGSRACYSSGLNGENVAYHTSGSDQPPNPAWRCVMEQWLNSDGHRINMLRASFQTMVTGIVLTKNEYTTSRGRKYTRTRVTCTQTFLSRPPQINDEDTQCSKSTAQIGASTPSSSPSPTPTTSAAIKETPTVTMEATPAPIVTMEAKVEKEDEGGETESEASPSPSASRSPTPSMSVAKEKQMMVYYVPLRNGGTSVLADRCVSGKCRLCLKKSMKEGKRLRCLSNYLTKAVKAWCVARSGRCDKKE